MPGTRLPPSGPTCRSLLDWRGSASIATLPPVLCSPAMLEIRYAHRAGGDRCRANPLTIMAGPDPAHLKTAILEIA